MYNILTDLSFDTCVNNIFKIIHTIFNMDASEGFDICGCGKADPRTSVPNVNENVDIAIFDSLFRKYIKIVYRRYRVSVSDFMCVCFSRVDISNFPIKTISI